MAIIVHSSRSYCADVCGAAACFNNKKSNGVRFRIYFKKRLKNLSDFSRSSVGTLILLYFTLSMSRAGTSSGGGASDAR